MGRKMLQRLEHLPGSDNLAIQVLPVEIFEQDLKQAAVDGRQNPISDHIIIFARSFVAIHQTFSIKFSVHEHHFGCMDDIGVCNVLFFFAVEPCSIVSSLRGIVDLSSSA